MTHVPICDDSAHLFVLASLINLPFVDDDNFGENTQKISIFPNHFPTPINVVYPPKTGISKIDDETDEVFGFLRPS